MQGAVEEQNSGQDGNTQKDDKGSQPTPQNNGKAEATDPCPTAHPSAHASVDHEDDASQAPLFPGQPSTLNVPKSFNFLRT